MRIIGILCLLICLFSCAGYKVNYIPTAESSKCSGKPIAPNQVVIYRMQKLEKSDYLECGMIDIQGTGVQIEKIYESLRKSAAKKGANVVSDLKIKVDVQTSRTSSTSCDSKGVCHTQTSNITYYPFSVSGLLLRRK